MRVTGINSVTFTGRIIDAHMHNGKWWRESTLYDYTPEIDRFTKQPLPNGDTVDKVVVSNLDCMVRVEPFGQSPKFLSNEVEGNRALLELAKKNSRIVPLATCQPQYGNVENIRTLITQNPKVFAGLKFHPEQLNIPANSEVYNPYMELAQKENLPCLFHSGQSFDTAHSKASALSRPRQIYATAKRYPEVPVIMAHLGGNEGENTLKAVDLIIDSVKNRNAKLYADISWVDCDNPAKPTLLQAIKKLKNANALDRIMFGTDAPLGRFGHNGENWVPPIDAYTNNINDIKAMIRKEFNQEADSIIDKIFFKNANDLYIEKSWISKPIKSCRKAIILGLSILAAATVTVATAIQRKKATQTEPVNASQVVQNKNA